MSLGRHLKVFQIHQTCSSIILEHKNNKDALWIQGASSILLSSDDAKQLKTNSTKIVDAYGCLGAVNLHRGAESLGYYLVLVTGCKTLGRLLDNEIYRVTDVSFLSIKDVTIDSGSSSSEMKRLLCSGSFYFASSNSEDSKFVDITHSMQTQSSGEERHQFLWNRSLLSYFSVRGVPCKSWFLYVMCGGIDIKTIYVSAQQARTAVINRLSCERVGTRYNVRGVDSSGNVANFVESEQVICIGETYSSFIQTRGSVPLFWEQPGLNVGSHKVKMPFDFSVSHHAFERHLDAMTSSYSNCTLVNLLGSKEGEAELSRVYQIHHEKSKFSQSVSMINFDYHAECRAGKSSNISKLTDLLNPLLSEFDILVESDEVRKTQNGVLRVNCLDCLDRTNGLQSHVGTQMVSVQLEALGHKCTAQLLGRFTDAVKELWQHTGDLISRMYAGTGALEGKDKVGKLKDGAKSVSRAIQNNFLDSGKQGTMDAILRFSSETPELYQLSRAILDQHQFRHSSSSLQRQMFNRRANFSEDVALRISVGTWNVNGGKFFRSIAYKDMTLKDWLVVDDPPDEAPASTYYQAQYDYSSPEEGDLSFVMYDIILVDYALEDGEWLHGVKGEEEGIFPAAYAQLIEHPYLVLFDFPAQQDGDLGLWTNEVVDVTSINDEWMSGKVYRDGKLEEGTFPANFVEKIGNDTSAAASHVDIYAIGFEEMVELNAGNIVNTSQANQKEWGEKLGKTISESDEYVLVTSEQLVGVCLFVFVRKELVESIRDISVSTIKTGMGGTTGNKGAVAVSMLLHSTSLCFVCSHFAAGQTQVHERNNDFGEISSKVFFSKGRNLLVHDYVFWCGDFNYRIDLSGDEVKQLVKSETWGKLRDFDQLLEQKKMGNVFKGFNEGEISFAPTYKYDLFSDDYDTSEKCRVPAWTDRVLWKRRNWLQDSDQDIVDVGEDHGRLVYYNRSELKTSDHRPVLAIIDVKIAKINVAAREETYKELEGQLQPLNQPVYVYIEGKPVNEELFRRYAATFDVGECLSSRCFSNSLLLIYPESWMVTEVLNHDGEMFDGSRMRVSLSNDNVVEEPVLRHVSTEPQMRSDNGDLEVEFYHSKLQLPNSHSSGSLSSLNTPSMTRPNSTPQLHAMVQEDPPPVKSRTPKRAPPRPPAISSVAPPRPPSISPSIVKKSPPLPPKAANSSTSSFMVPLQPTVVDSAPVSAPAPQPLPALESWDFPSAPPKIKPRRTVPKRRAPVPPQKNQQNAPKPPTGNPPNLPPNNNLITGSLLDDAFSFNHTPAPLQPRPSRPAPQIKPNPPTQSLPPPLIPLSSTNGSSLLPPLIPLSSSNGVSPQAPLIPLSSTNATSLPPPLIPQSAVNPGQSNFTATSPQDPWSAFSQPMTSNVNQSFSTDFSDLI